MSLANLPAVIAQARETAVAVVAREAQQRRALSLLGDAHRAKLRGCPVQAIDAYNRAVALQRGDADGFRLTDKVA